MDTELKQYIDEHKVKGHDVLIFRDGGDEFLKLLYECGGRVSMIVWYEYCRINEQRMGMADMPIPRTTASCGLKHSCL